MSPPAFTDLVPQPPLRAAITAACRAPEPDCVAALLARAPMTADEAATTEALARRLVAALRARPAGGAVDGLIREYDLSSQEGVALMCLAEALLRIPDRATRDALIRDKLSDGDWRAHLGQSPSVFVNAATWGLVVTGRLVATGSESGLGGALTRLIGRGGEPVIRAGVDLAMRMLGEQFVTGETIEQALGRARRMEARGYRHSYDMLGEAATTAADAERYLAAYQHAIHAIGAAAAGRGLLHGPGISIKLSALHPRYTRSQRGRVMAELLPRLRGLALLARRYDIGLNIDAEEADRLDLSLDLLEALCLDRALSGWNGIGFVVQAYQKRAPFVLEWLIDLARRSGRRIMLRLVKGAYWDSEIKRAQVDGLADFPVFTRKLHTDVSYLACARLLLDAPDAVFPQFATHNAQTLAAIHSMAGPEFHPGQYEFQCLHGMGEPLYDQVVGPAKLDRPCRIYAPVGTHQTLLAYLVRRLLENGANSSFVNRIADPSVPVEDLIANPLAQRPIGASHPRIALPRALFANRPNSAGLDLASEQQLAELQRLLRYLPPPGPPGTPVRNPADAADLVGYVQYASAEQVDQAIAFSSSWGTAAERAAVLLKAADLLESRMPSLLGLIIREAGKTVANAIGEVREAVDFLRYYATGARDHLGPTTPLGPVACISPWNFPLAIFTGQVAAALAAGNPVLAKPAEETPLIAAAAVAILHQAGVPPTALQLLHGEGEVGARLVADPRIRGVVFTGSTEVARLIQQRLAERLNPDGSPVPLIAETGGQNAMLVDSSALAEQVVGDVLVSAFDSAGQRCSALRVLCLQEDVADRVLAMLKGALAELKTGNPGEFATDVGPLITRQAAAGITAHIAAMRAAGCPVHANTLPPDCAAGHFVAPTIIELADIAQLKREVFGPVLHVLRYRRDRFDALLAGLAATGYALTFGVHSRIDETIARAVAAAPAGNIYVNRTLIGAVVGVQPFGGHGLSGTGPKAGGPLYLRRLVAEAPPLPAPALGVDTELPGPVGERNLYRLEPRGVVLCVAASPAALAEQEAAARATGNQVTHDAEARCDAVLFDGASDALRALAGHIAARTGPIVAIHTRGASGYRLEALLRERAVSTNTTAAGGNASLMMIG
jgi:RHH-type proline utilization regulon transcriptional repressor/proline dehydrogenase/delta 1-pyrroline-5-carboxylate dehydrogenase